MTPPRRRRRDGEPLNQTVGTRGNVPTATGDTSNRVDGGTDEPTHDEIARRAYQLCQARGGEHGREWDDWFQAERELQQPAPHGVVDRILATAGPHAAA